MEPSAAQDLGRRNIRQGNRFLDAPAAHLEMILAIEHFIGEAMHLRFPKEISQRRAQNADGDGTWQRIAPTIRR